MPPMLSSDDDASDVDIPANGVSKHMESAVEADVEAKDQLKDDLMSEIEETQGEEAAQEEKERVSPTASNDAAEEDAFEVEAIHGHEWRKKSKKSPYVLLYNVKWKGWPISDNTLEPEENLIGSRDILANYHHKIGGAPQPPTGEESKKLSTKQSKKSLRSESLASATEDSSAPPAKRQKRSKEADAAASEEEEDDSLFGSWMPKGDKWETSIKEIQTVERDEKTQDLYILMIFKNGKKSRVKNNLVRQKCPQRLLDFYEEHLNFSVSNSAA